MQEMAQEMERTTFVKKVITDIPAAEVLAQAQAFFREHGYRAGKGGKPNTVRLMGRAELALPSVIGEIEVRTTNKGRTIVGLSGYGALLSERLREFHDLMRAARQARVTAAPVPSAAPLRPETRTEQIEEEMLEAQAETGQEYDFKRDRYEGSDQG